VIYPRLTQIECLVVSHRSAKTVQIENLSRLLQRGHEIIARYSL